MEQWQCCRTCLAVLNLNPIFQVQEHHEKYSQVILEATGVTINLNDSLPQQMCTTCINSTNQAYRFRKKCQEAQKSLAEQINNIICEVKIEGVILQSEQLHSIDISDFIDVNDFVDSTLSDYNLELDENSSQDISSQHISSQHISSQHISNQHISNQHISSQHVSTQHISSEHASSQLSQEVNEKSIKKNHKKSKPRDKSKLLKGTLRVRKTDKEKKEREKEEIECEYCHKVLTSKLSLRNHYKIHTGFDVVCEHCGKKFITRRLLLMHCKAKHGYEKTDKCSFCEYRASNAEQVKIHERLHTGEKPYVCAECGVGFHRKSSYLQHVAIHLPEKTVQCTQCPARFKSVTLMRIHANRHRATQYTYKCVICAHSFARRRNVARHLLRIHAMQAAPEHIERSKCV